MNLVTLVIVVIVVISPIALAMDESNEVIEDSSQKMTFCKAGAGRDYFNCKPTEVEFFPSSNNDEEKIVLISFDEEHKKLALCAEEDGSDTSKVNLMLHVFCRQMGYMTFVSRRSTNIMEDSDRAILASASCNGTEQRLEDCYWPHATLTRCKKVIEVNCGSCSKYFSHIDDGVITSPGFPASFPFTVQCDWLIHTHLGSEIELRIVNFNLPSSLLPLAHIGTSTCEASNAFIEIRYNVADGESPYSEHRTISNSERYCVTNNPPKRLVIRSKAVWLHFSSGIHSSFMSSYPSRTPSKRAVGLKIHFKALPGTSSGINSQYYVYAGGALFALLIFTTVACCIYFRKRRSSTSSEEPELSYSNKWARSICSSGITSQSSKSSRNALQSKEHMLSHSYEEIRPRPQVPPRTFRPSSNLTWSADERRAPATRRTALSYRSPPTYQSRHNLLPLHYMQLVCDEDGNCQYIPKEEIEAARLTHRIIPGIYGSNVFGSDVPPYPSGDATSNNASPPVFVSKSNSQSEPHRKELDEENKKRGDVVKGKERGEKENKKNEAQQTPHQAHQANPSSASPACQEESSENNV